MSHRILITGGFGYVGGRVAQLLSKDTGYEILLGSRTSQPAPRWLPRALTVATNWESQEELAACCENVDSIVHAAAMNEIDAAADPVGALQANGVATARLLKAAIGKGVRRFIYFSTAHVYGSPLIGTLEESMCPLPIHPYATSHRAAEDVVLAAHQKQEIDGVAIRLSNSFGAPAHAGVNRWTLLANDLCRQAVTNRCLTLRSTGLQRRDFVTLTDVGRAVQHLIQLEKQQLGAGLFNLGGEWAPTIFEMSQLIVERYRLLWGTELDINRQTPPIQEHSPPLDYRMDRLKSTGFHLSEAVETEIDETLKLCAHSFPD